MISASDDDGARPLQSSGIFALAFPFAAEYLASHWAVLPIVYDCFNPSGMKWLAPLGRKLCALMQVAMIAALCTPTASVLILSWLVIIVAGVAGCCCIPLWIALMLVPILHLALWPLAETLHLCTLWFHPLQLVLVVLFNSAIGTNTLLANMVVSPSATCTGGVFASTCWHRYCTCTPATCTVWWWSRSVVLIYTDAWRHRRQD